MTRADYFDFVATEDSYIGDSADGVDWFTGDSAGGDLYQPLETSDADAFVGESADGVDWFHDDHSVGDGQRDDGTGHIGACN